MRQGGERKCRRLVEEELRESLKRAFQAYGEQLETFTSFKYLGRVLIVGDGNWKTMAGNLRKARKIWTRITRILGREGVDPRIYGLFFKAIVQSVLIFGSYMWVLTYRMDWALGRSQHRVAQRITGRQPRRLGEGRREYTLLAAAKEEAGFEEIRVYIKRRQSTVT